MSVFDKDTEKMLVQKRLIIDEYVQATGITDEEDFDMEDVVEWQASERVKAQEFMSTKSGITGDEGEIWAWINKIQHKFCDLSKQHPDEARSWTDGIHILQTVLGWRILRRDYPADFPKKFTKYTGNERKIGK